MVLNLCDTYRPKTLSDVYGQTSTVSFFKSVVAHPEEAPRYFYLEGGFGVGKSTIARAFACSLIGPDYFNSPNYIEIDSSEKRIAENFDYIKDLIFQEVPGWKVVLIDECHLLASSCVQMFLKILEDYTGKLFILFASTETQLMFPPLLSRLHTFSLELFTPEQCIDYAKKILAKEVERLNAEGDSNSALTVSSISDRALTVAALNSQGHLRSMLKQVEIILFQGEQYYLDTFSQSWTFLEDYFFGSTSTAELVPKFYGFHPVLLKANFAYYFRDQVLNPASPHYGREYSVQLPPDRKSVV